MRDISSSLLLIPPFRLGATGYIGGDLLYLLNETHPDFEITALVRNREKAAAITAEYPQVQIVYGDNESSQVIEEQVARADVIFRKLEAFDLLMCAQAFLTSLCSQRLSFSSVRN